MKDRIQKLIEIDAKGCWLWTKGRMPFGYGAIVVNGKTKLAHRVSYEAHVGPIPSGLCVLHRCDVPPCVNPEHLFLGTQLDNMRDKIAKGRQGDSSVGRRVRGDEHWARQNPDRALRGQKNGNYKSRNTRCSNCRVELTDGTRYKGRCLICHRHSRCEATRRCRARKAQRARTF